MIKKKVDEQVTDLEAKYPPEKLSDLLLERAHDVQQESPENLLFLAACGLESVEAKNSVSKIAIFINEVYRTILDVIRQNSRLLELYSAVAIKSFDFCQKYKMIK